MSDASVIETSMERFFPAQSATGTQLRAALERVVATNANVLIRAERGTGADVVAQALHMRSARVGSHFHVIARQVAAGELERAVLIAEGAEFDAGTVFLAAVERLSSAAQDALAPIATRRDGRVRFVAATASDLAEDVERGAFRADLFYALNGVSLRLRPLRERLDELVTLAHAILAGFDEHAHLSLASEAALASHAWPGNVRELELVLERAALIAEGEEIEPRHLALAATSAREPIAALGAEDRSLQAVEATAIRRALAECDGNKLRAARLLGIHRATLYHKLREFQARPARAHELPAALHKTEKAARERR